MEIGHKRPNKTEKTESLTTNKSRKTKEPKATKGTTDTHKTNEDKQPINTEPQLIETNGMRILIWNVNGIRAIRKSLTADFDAFIKRQNADIVCLGEIKMDEKADPNYKKILSFYPYSFWAFSKRKGYSGTAIFTKKQPLQIQKGIEVEGKKDEEGRYMMLEYEKFWMIHTYVPNSGAKLERLEYRTTAWHHTILQKLKELNKTKNVIWCGDLNVAHEEIDVFNPKSKKNKIAGFMDSERENFSEVLNNGFIDAYRHLYPTEVQYTFYSYRFNARALNRGWRLDYFVVSEPLMKHIKSVDILNDVVGSDHVPLVLEFNPAYETAWKEQKERKTKEKEKKEEKTQTKCTSFFQCLDKVHDGDDS